MIIGIGTIIGGIVGVIVGALLGDPFRDKRGRFITWKDGFVNWVLQILIVGGMGAAVGTWGEQQIRESPGLMLVLFVVSLIVYRIYVDPRTGAN